MFLLPLVGIALFIFLMARNAKAMSALRKIRADKKK